MKRIFLIGAITTLLMATVPLSSWAATNFNLSRSNSYRVSYDTTILTPAQADSLLKELDKLGPRVNEETVRKVLQQLGVNLAPIKEIRILPPDNTSKEPLIIILQNPANEPQAISCCIHGTKSNSSY